MYDLAIDFLKEIDFFPICWNLPRKNDLIHLRRETDKFEKKNSPVLEKTLNFLEKTLFCY